MQAAGMLEAWFRERDDRRQGVGQFTYFLAVKPAGQGADFLPVKPIFRESLNLPVTNFFYPSGYCWLVGPCRSQAGKFVRLDALGIEQIQEKFQMKRARNSGSRRSFLKNLFLFGLASVPLLGKRAAAKPSENVFGAQFLEKGQVANIPDGYYDPETRMFHLRDTDEPAFFEDGKLKEPQLAGTSTYTAQYTNYCTSIPPGGGCNLYDQNQDTSKLDWD